MNAPHLPAAIASPREWASIRKALAANPFLPENRVAVTAARLSDWIRAVLALSLTAELYYVIYVVINAEGQKGEGPIANILLGALVSAVGGVLSYYFGSSPRETDKPRGTESDPTHTEVVNAPTDPVPTVPQTEPEHELQAVPDPFTEPVTTALPKDPQRDA